MDLRQIDLNLLLAFEALLQTQSVSKAATRLGVGQPAMSASLAKLRVLLGDELFVRTKGLMQPTPRALAIAGGIEIALTSLRQTFTGKISFDPAAASHCFTIASTDYTTQVLLPELVAEIALRAPGVDLRVIGYDKSDIPDLIDRGEIDFALGVFPAAPDRSVRQYLCQERFVGLTRRDHPLLRNGEITLADYAGALHALVSVRRDHKGEIDRYLNAHGFSRRTALVTPHMLALPSVLARGDLVAAVPERIARQFAGEKLVVFELPLEVPSWHIEMVWSQNSRKDQAGLWIRKLVATIAKKIDRKI